MNAIDVSEGQKHSVTELPKTAWQPMSVRYLGEVRQVVQGGGGKLTIIGGDPGESRKPQGGEP